jgi:hypothetical protein
MGGESMPGNLVDRPPLFPVIATPDSTTACFLQRSSSPCKLFECQLDSTFRQNIIPTVPVLFRSPSNFYTPTILNVKMLLTSVLALGSASVVAAVPLAAAAPQGLRVVGASVLGSGCPYGTADVHADPSNTAFEIRLSDYVVKTGPGTMASDWRKNCKLTLNLQYDAGFQYVHTCAKTGRPYVQS